MIIFHLLLLLMILIPIPRVLASNSIFEDYMDRHNTLYIKGIFVYMVFIAHFRDYITLEGTLDNLYLWIVMIFDQMIVTMFFFYSGYGIYESVKTKGVEYIKQFPKKRILFVWVYFVICITLYLIGGGY